LSSEIRGLLEGGERKRTRLMDVFFAASPVAHSRLGLIVPKHGRRVVDRNVVKRRLREIGRRAALPRLDGAGVHVDLLVRARRTAYDADFMTLEGEVTAVVEELCSRRS
jgi:ribonuclease P protein component